MTAAELMHFLNETLEEYDREILTLQGYSSEYVDVSFPDGSHWRITAKQTQPPTGACQHKRTQSIGDDGWLCLDCGYAESPSDPEQQTWL